MYRMAHSSIDKYQQLIWSAAFVAGKFLIIYISLVFVICFVNMWKII